MAHHRHRLPNAFAPAALGTLPPRNRSPTGAPRRSAAGRLPPSPAPIPSPTANAPGSGGGAVRGRLTHGGGGSQLRSAPRPALVRGVASLGRRRGRLEGVDTVSLIIKNDLIQKPFLSAKTSFVGHGSGAGLYCHPPSHIPSLLLKEPKSFLVPSRPLGRQF